MVRWIALGVTSEGLIWQTGRVVVLSFEVTAQVNATVPAKLPTGLTVMTAVAVPPGSTPAGGENVEAESVKFVCAAARGK